MADTVIDLTDAGSSTVIDGIIFLFNPFDISGTKFADENGDGSTDCRRCCQYVSFVEYRTDRNSAGSKFGSFRRHLMLLEQVIFWLCRFPRNCATSF
jgi:hypothetical protein